MEVVVGGMSGLLRIVCWKGSEPLESRQNRSDKGIIEVILFLHLFRTHSLLVYVKLSHPNLHAR